MGLFREPFPIIGMGDGDYGRRSFVTVEAAEVDDAVFGADMGSELCRNINRTAFGQEGNDTGSAMLASRRGAYASAATLRL